MLKSGTDSRGAVIAYPAAENSERRVWVWAGRVRYPDRRPRLEPGGAGMQHRRPQLPDGGERARLAVESDVLVVRTGVSHVVHKGPPPVIAWGVAVEIQTDAHQVLAIVDVRLEVTLAHAGELPG